MNGTTTHTSIRLGAILAAAFLFGGCSTPEPQPDAATATTSSGSSPTSSDSSSDVEAAGAKGQIAGGPNRAQPDVFHPDNQPDAAGNRPPMPEPVRGGRVIVHIASMPRHMNYMTENSAITHWVLLEAHEFLLQRDFNSWKHKPVLATGWEIEDQVILSGDGKDRLYGVVTEDGEDYVITPKSKGNALSEARHVKKSEVDRVERGTVFTFDLRKNVKWHDGHPFNAHDVYFSFKCYQNPTVDADNARATLGKLTDAEVIDDYTIRFFYANQYFLAVDAFTNLTVVPSHLYNLGDKDNPDYDPKADILGRKQGQYVNDNPHNVKWVGLGPYKITEINDGFIEAKRFEDYFDKQRNGYLDTIRWRHISSDDAAKTALLNGELDYWDRLRTEDYYGEFTQKPEFADNFYKGYTYQPRMQYLAWNMRRPQFAQAEVRRALAHAFDWEEFIATQANGLGVRVTGYNFFLSPEYDNSVVPIPFDMDKAQELLTDAGWYDRDGDGIIDKDGVKLEFEYLMTPGNIASQTQALKLQENLSKLGVKLNIGTRDWAAFIERVRNKDFDCFGLAWILDVESDPEQLWMSYQGEPGKDRTSNYPGVADPKVDDLIKRIQRELDSDARIALSKELHRTLYEMQPYMFTYAPPVKFAVSKRIRNFWSYGINPGYRLREWFVTGSEPGVAGMKQ